MIPLWHTPPKIWGSTLTEGSQQIFDIYSLTHISHGILLFSLATLLGSRSPTLHALMTQIVWEIIENTNYVIHRYRRQNIHRTYKGDSVVNMIGDVFFAWIGIMVARYRPYWEQLGWILFTELLVYHQKQDNLMLNILALIGAA